jgi:hypothetical protein
LRLADFIETFFERLQDSGIKWCILRNYDGLPEVNIGTDVDLLVPRRSIPAAIRILQELNSIQLVGCCRRAGAVHVFLDNVEWRDRRALQIDLIHDVAWKGLTYISPQSILQRRRAAPGQPAFIQVPDEVDEAIVSLFSSYIVGGFIKEKYYRFVRSVFTEKSDEVHDRLLRSFGGSIARLIEAVISDDRDALMILLSKLRRSLLGRALSRRPIGSVAKIGRHFFCEAKIRYTSTYVFSVGLVGLRGEDGVRVSQSLAESLAFSAKAIDIRTLDHELTLGGPTAADCSAVEPCGRRVTQALRSTFRLSLWVARLWLDGMRRRTSNATIVIWRGYYCDLLIDPGRFSYCGPVWVARCLALLVPRPDALLILMSAGHSLRRNEAPSSSKGYFGRQDVAPSMSGATLVDMERPHSEVVQAVRREVIRLMALKAMPRAAATR